MSVFLLTYNRRTRQADVARIDDRDAAVTQLFEAERRVRDDPDIEIVMLAAEDEADLRKTHSHYFESALDDSLRRQGVSEADFIASRPAAQRGAGDLLGQIRESMSPDTPSDLLTLLATKRSIALVSAYRDILRIGIALKDELIAANQSTEEASPDLRERVGAWCNRCIAWANDAPLSLAQNRMFRADPTSTGTTRDWLEAVSMNVAALWSVHEQFDPSPR